MDNEKIHVCGARTKTCRKCGRRYSKEEYDLWNCPDCGEPRACRRSVVREGARCKFHGGASLKGAAAPSFTHGRYSKYLPTRLLERYQTAQTDGELLSLRDEVAMLDVRLSELVAGLDTGESVDVWAALGAAYEDLTGARNSGDSRGMAQALIQIGDLIEKGRAKGPAWREIIGLFDQRRKLVESERKRIVELQQVITAEKAMALITAVVHTVASHVDDRTVLNAIAVDVRRLIDQPGG